MGFWDRLFGKKKNQEAEPLIENSKAGTYNEVIIPPEETYIFPEGEIVPFDGDILDATSPKNIAMFRHNIKVLSAQAKQKGKIDNFYAIRQDNFFPKNWEWKVLSDQTNLELTLPTLSYELKKAYALEMAGIELYTKIGEIEVPNYDREEEAQIINEALAKVDKTVGAILLPSYFRSTKNFTVNTPLGVTGNYNAVSTNRNFIFFDKLDNFLASGYGYSISGHDAYLDVTHEPLKISEHGFVLIADEKYEDIMKKTEIAEELSQRKVIRFKGDETLAINMMLAANGALPAQLDYDFLENYQELNVIYEKSFRALAEEYGLAYDKSHAGALLPEGGGHFSNYYDEMNTDRQQAANQVIEFFRNRFPENADLFNGVSFGIPRKGETERAQTIIRTIGVKNLLDAINEYNENARRDMAQKFEIYSQERASITTDEHDTFVSTVQAVDAFYKTPEASSRYDVEPVIQRFFQGKSKKEQLEAAHQVLTMLSATVDLLPNVDRRVLTETRVVESNMQAPNIDKYSIKEYGE